MKSCAISGTRRPNDKRRIRRGSGSRKRRFRISIRARVLSRKRCGLGTAGASFLSVNARGVFAGGPAGPRGMTLLLKSLTRKQTNPEALTSAVLNFILITDIEIQNNSLRFICGTYHYIRASVALS